MDVAVTNQKQMTPAQSSEPWFEALVAPGTNVAHVAVDWTLRAPDPLLMINSFSSFVSGLALNESLSELATETPALTRVIAEYLNSQPEQPVEEDRSTRFELAA